MAYGNGSEAPVDGNADFGRVGRSDVKLQSYLVGCVLSFGVFAEGDESAWWGSVSMYMYSV